MTYAIRANGGQFRRSGVLFKSTEWTLIDKPTEDQLNEPRLEVLKVKGPEDPALRGILIAGSDAKPEDTPDPAAIKRYLKDNPDVLANLVPVDEKAIVEKYLGDNNLVAMPQGEYDAMLKKVQEAGQPAKADDSAKPDPKKDK